MRPKRLKLWITCCSSVPFFVPRRSRYSSPHSSRSAVLLALHPRMSNNPESTLPCHRASPLTPRMVRLGCRQNPFRFRRPANQTNYAARCFAFSKERFEEFFAASIRVTSNRAPTSLQSRHRPWANQPHNPLFEPTAPLVLL